MRLQLKCTPLPRSNKSHSAPRRARCQQLQPGRETLIRNLSLHKHRSDTCVDLHLQYLLPSSASSAACSGCSAARLPDLEGHKHEEHVLLWIHLVFRVDWNAWGHHVLRTAGSNASMAFSRVPCDILWHRRCGFAHQACSEVAAPKVVQTNSTRSLRCTFLFRCPPYASAHPHARRTVKAFCSERPRYLCDDRLIKKPGKSQQYIRT
mmetsp:Transcript_129212/g.359818  ORF Transcript_129212/g.359818 Transcript_129212/m.359818 type:complete len:207 (+) Transcript_129212:240-860(+)